MLSEAPLLKIRRNFPRPDAATVAAFGGTPTGFVVDAMGGRGGLDFRIKPVVPLAAPLVGVAITCDSGPGDNLAIHGAVHAARPGDVIVAATDGFMATAVAGDLVLGMAKNRKAAGFVTDGAVRDLAGILAVGLPAFAAGITPNSPARSGPGTVGLPIVIGGVRVAPGDIVVADIDGVVVVPREIAEEVAAKLAGVRAAEAAADARVKGGQETADSFLALLASGRVEEIS